jgi:uncharacterized membrane protein
MWSINSMFGTGYKGFIIITVLLACFTYIIVFVFITAEHKSWQGQQIITLKNLVGFKKKDTERLDANSQS